MLCFHDPGKDILHDVFAASDVYAVLCMSRVRYARRIYESLIDGLPSRSVHLSQYIHVEAAVAHVGGHCCLPLDQIPPETLDTRFPFIVPLC
jgi:hypothetical protein